MKQQVNLNNAPELDEHDVDQLVRLLGARCRDAKLRRLRSMLTYGRSAIGSHGIYNRVIKKMACGRIVPGSRTPMRSAPCANS